MLSEFAISSGIQQSIVFLIPLVGTLLTLASFKASQVAVGPLSVVLNAGAIAALPSLSAAFARGDIAALLREAKILAALNCGLGLLYAGVLWALPASVGQLFFSDNWHTAQHMAPILALQVSLIGICQGAMFGLQVTRNIARSLKLRLFMAPLIVGAAMAGLALDQTIGLVVGMAGASLIGSMLWWLTFLRAVSPSSSAPPVPAR
jgi:O-antigen/teichoic acid export membrane protein